MGIEVYPNNPPVVGFFKQRPIRILEELLSAGVKLQIDLFSAN